MVKQERALRTRAAVLRAAADHFDRSGYDGTSLSQVSGAAGLSVGALTFHFATKAELADAVLEEGWAMTQAVLDRVVSARASPLCTIVDLTIELACLMERETSVRSAIRLARERPTAPAWSECWLPVVRKLLDEAHRAGQLHEDALPADVMTLVEHLTGGAEAYLRSRLGTVPECESAASQLKRVWSLALTGVSAADDLTVPRPRNPQSSEG